MSSLVVVAGSSCSGKSTLSRRLAHAMNAQLLHLDHYWISGSHKPVVRGHESRERPEQYDGAQMYRDARALRANGHFVVCEGFLSMLYAGAGEAKVSLFLDIDRDEMVRRRTKRYDEGGNKTWNNDPEFEALIDKAWHAHGIEEWELWGQCQTVMPGVTVLNGMRSPDEIFEEALAHVKARAGMSP